MKVLDPGHHYELDRYIGGPSSITSGKETIRFMKREGVNYPGNIGHYDGTNLQEVIRVLIDRVKYLDGQIPCDENKSILIDLRNSLYELESRACQRHKLDMVYLGIPIEHYPICFHCGHVVCKEFNIGLPG